MVQGLGFRDSNSQGMELGIGKNDGQMQGGNRNRNPCPPYPVNGSFPKKGSLFGCPHNKDYSILGSIRSPYLGKLLSGMLLLSCFASPARKKKSVLY